ncbi:DUF3558 domain-containing protein [Nocardia blacklockiae]|uniref:DUF3558 domain-containing protein n=1 Tax=Nocardia blacklockiae TaxID=480036 RepID=UPI001895581E|nr:DUF3558 domain-containing protein [Nocardia blacklockiae]MBF6173634.1 DUF3558 domain-containing protein [Nocardia blacklockiae]
MRRIKLVLAVATAGAALVAAGGCMDSQSADKTPTSAAAPALFNPCTSIPDDALRTAGVDPATRDSGIAGVPQSGFEICGWRGQQYSITVYSSARTVADYESRSDYGDFRDVTIAGRSGRQFRDQSGGAGHLACDVIFAAAQGSVQIELLNKASADNPPEPCSALQQAATALVPHLPK